MGLYEELILYHRLSTRSKRAIQRQKTRFGRPYDYRPRITLIDRLAQEMGWTREQVMRQLRKERAKLLQSHGGVAV